MVTDLRDPQFSNAELPMDMTPSLMVTDVRDVRALNAFSKMDVTAYVRLSCVIDDGITVSPSSSSS